MLGLCRATSSNMEDEEKAAIKELITHLGGRYTAKMSRNNSHLIVDRAVGQKWANAAAFGAKAVTTAWLIDSARTGKLHCRPFTADQLLQCIYWQLPQFTAHHSYTNAHLATNQALGQQWTNAAPYGVIAVTIA
jgi:hypothetical protein